MASSQRIKHRNLLLSGKGFTNYETVLPCSVFLFICHKILYSLSVSQLSAVSICHFYYRKKNWNQVLTVSIERLRLHLLLSLINLFIYFWLHWIFVAARGLSLVAVSGGYCSLWCTGFSLRWLLLLRSTGFWHAGFSSCGWWAQ